MEGNESGGINVSALQSYLHQQNTGSGGAPEDEETVFSVFVFLAWFYKNVPCFLDSATGNVIASTTCLGANLPTTVVFGSEMTKNIFGLPKLLPDSQSGDASGEGGGEDAAAASGENDGEGIQAAHPDDPYAHDDYPHANQEVAEATGNGLNNVNHELQQEPEYHHDRSPSPTPTTHQPSQYDHDFH
ncbi:hypothetical protein ECHHL_0468 [Ehrlichia chaffeensis str. Heartland]|uniref:Uncharacterized protein n=1 Tax=Ehrlichia chaffeensis (strain ATCC CRL-10679 / Arkansas) TaxID=205920 RepID=Q2GGT5_EHRCR|nr:hypothetical protein [Ehrlichia chaffeensis]ABD44574.1 hypothetical protein ECH_0535 [Ehrlichia chaffeensis str. Arkansas]AHX03628.1 hypothetical protein ECHHL_0468 [Ehrlichia chaffeensis str. Heartland]AHX08432.1 hypothetical protein ECHSTV_0578 [Ehrlichia chaffeensis str. Saint Vincent]AHX10711.1 hypothetical protein ECHWP_0465 [Ehrlichia chaffeensis str. West Paces]